MSEIDVTYCKFARLGDICANPTINTQGCKCSKIPIQMCYYKQLQQRKAENEELKSKLDMQESIGYPLCFTCIVEDCECNKSKLYEECVNEIEKIVKEYHPLFVNTPLYMIDKVIRQIKEVKENK